MAGCANKIQLGLNTWTNRNLKTGTAVGRCKAGVRLDSESSPLPSGSGDCILPSNVVEMLIASSGFKCRACQRTGHLTFKCPLRPDLRGSQASDESEKQPSSSMKQQADIREVAEKSPRVTTSPKKKVHFNEEELSQQQASREKQKKLNSPESTYQQLWLRQEEDLPLYMREARRMAHHELLALNQEKLASLSGAAMYRGVPLEVLRADLAAEAAASPRQNAPVVDAAHATAAQVTRPAELWDKDALCQIEQQKESDWLDARRSAIRSSSTPRTSTGSESDSSFVRSSRASTPRTYSESDVTSNYARIPGSSTPCTCSESDVTNQARMLSSPRISTPRTSTGSESLDSGNVTSNYARIHSSQMLSSPRISFPRTSTGSESDVTLIHAGRFAIPRTSTGSESDFGYATSNCARMFSSPRMLSSPRITTPRTSTGSESDSGYVASIYAGRSSMPRSSTPRTSTGSESDLTSSSARMLSSPATSTPRTLTPRASTGSGSASPRTPTAPEACSGKGRSGFWSSLKEASKKHLQKNPQDVEDVAKLCGFSLGPSRIPQRPVGLQALYATVDVPTADSKNVAKFMAKGKSRTQLDGELQRELNWTVLAHNKAQGKYRLLHYRSSLNGLWHGSVPVGSPLGASPVSPAPRKPQGWARFRNRRPAKEDSTPEESEESTVADSPVVCLSSPESVSSPPSCRESVLLSPPSAGSQLDFDAASARLGTYRLIECAGTLAFVGICTQMQWLEVGLALRCVRSEPAGQKECFECLVFRYVRRGTKPRATQIFMRTWALPVGIESTKDAEAAPRTLKLAPAQRGRFFESDQKPPRGSPSHWQEANTATAALPIHSTFCRIFGLDPDPAHASQLERNKHITPDDSPFQGIWTAGASCLHYIAHVCVENKTDRRKGNNVQPERVELIWRLAYNPRTHWMELQVGQLPSLQAHVAPLARFARYRVHHKLLEEWKQNPRPATLLALSSEFSSRMGMYPRLEGLRSLVWHTAETAISPTLLMPWLDLAHDTSLAWPSPASLQAGLEYGVLRTWNTTIYPGADQLVAHFGTFLNGVNRLRSKGFCAVVRIEFLSPWSAQAAPRVGEKDARGETQQAKDGAAEAEASLEKAAPFFVRLRGEQGHVLCVRPGSAELCWQLQQLTPSAVQQAPSREAKADGPSAQQPDVFVLELVRVGPVVHFALRSYGGYVCVSDEYGLNLRVDASGGRDLEADEDGERSSRLVLHWIPVDAETVAAFWRGARAPFPATPQEPATQAEEQQLVSASTRTGNAANKAEKTQPQQTGTAEQKRTLDGPFVPSRVVVPSDLLRKVRELMDKLAPFSEADFPSANE
eukprot:g72799.t1